MPRPFPATLLLCAALSGLAGCAISEMKTDIARREEHLAAQQAELDAAQHKRAELAQQRDQLLAELRSRELTAAQLRGRLEQLQQINANTVAVTPEDRQRRETRTQKLKQATERVQVLEKDPSLGAQEKQKRLDKLREETRKTLEVLLDS